MVLKLGRSVLIARSMARLQCLLYLVNYDLQLDLVFGGGLNGRAPDCFLGGGVSYRW